MDRAQATLPYSSIEMTPYHLHYGINPRTSWDWNSPKGKTPLEKLNIQNAITMAKQIKTY